MTCSKRVNDLKIGEQRSRWHKIANFAILNYNTFRRTNIFCETLRVFHEHVPYNVLDLKTSICPQKPSRPNSFIVQDFFDQTEIILQDVRKNSLQVFIEYKAYYNKKANASKHEKRDIDSVSQPKTDQNGSGFLKTFTQISVGLGPTSLKKLNQITIFWCARSKRRKRKTLIAFDYNRLHLENP